MYRTIVFLYCIKNLQFPVNTVHQRVDMRHYRNTRTFSCSYFGDIKYFRSRFALAY